MNSIDAGVLKVGDKLPSINEMVSELKYARKTIVKSYEDLKDRGIIESRKLKGYYVVSDETQQKLKVALLLYAFHTFQEDFYNTFREHLGANVQLDVFFHHNNPDLFDTILTNIERKYGMYVVAPIQSESVVTRLQQFPPEKLLIVDRFVSLGPEYAYLTQEFEETTFNALESLLDRIKRYEEVILFFREDADYPIGIKKGFLSFVETHGLPGVVQSKYHEGAVQKGRFYIFISDNNMFELIKDCRAEGYVIGQNIGVLSHNDNLVKGIIGEGITTISTDFKKMARLAAKFVEDRTLIQQVLPSKLVERHSI